MNTPEVSFSYLNIIKTNLENKNNCQSALGYAMPSLLFICEFCNKTLTTPSLMMDHLEKVHKMEPSYICRLCMKSCPINQLSAKRWKHSCPDSNNKIAPAVASRVWEWKQTFSIDYRHNFRIEKCVFLSLCKTFHFTCFIKWIEFITM